MIASDPYPGFPRSGEFRTIICDPPWPYRQRFRTGGSSCPYPAMTEEGIFNLPVAEAAAQDCVLLFWTTNAHMALAIESVRHYGFEPKTIATWGKVQKNGKPRAGAGFWLRGSTEHAILAVKGAPHCPRTRALAGERLPLYTTLVLAPRGPHSEKPAAFHVIMEDIGLPPRLELFARQRRAAWTAWGNEPITHTVGTLRDVPATTGVPA